VFFFSNTKILIFGNFYFIIRKSLNSFNNKNNIKEKNISIFDGFSMKIPIFDLKKEYLKKDEK